MRAIKRVALAVWGVLSLVLVGLLVFLGLRERKRSYLSDSAWAAARAGTEESDRESAAALEVSDRERIKETREAVEYDAGRGSLNDAINALRQKPRP